MSTGERAYVDVTSANFADVALKGSLDVAVVVDFWAEWCGPCRSLSPVLERVVASLAPRAILAKADVEADPQLAAQYGVQSIPEVKIFRGGELVGGFIGALPEHLVRREIERCVRSESDDLTEQGDTLARAGDTAGAEAAYRRALESDASRPAARLALSRLLADRGEFDEAEKLLADIPRDAEEHIFAQALLAEMRIKKTCTLAGGKDQCRRSVEADGADLDARYGLGCCLAAEGRHREALDELLKVVEADKNFREGAARDAMVAVFAVIGQRSPLADEYRSKLARLLY